MKLCVISPGVVHAIPRTAAIAPFFDQIDFIDMKNQDVTGLQECANVTVHRPFPDGRLGFGGVRLRRLLRELAPDGIVCHYSAGHHLFNSVLYNGCPVAAIAMGHDVLYDRGDATAPPLFRLLVRMALRRIQFVSAKSEHLAGRLQEYGCKGRLDVNYWGSDLSAFAKRDKIVARRELQLPEDHPIILSPRAVEPRLNIHVIAESMLHIRQRHPNVLLVVLGRSSRSYRERIENFVRDNDLESNVRLVYEVGQDVLPLFYNASDAVVSMARSEGFPNTLLEAMASGVPIIAGRIPQIDELLQHEQNALLCDIDSGAIAESVLRVLDDPKSGRAIVEAAKKTAAEYGDINRNAARFSEILIEVIQKHDRRRWRRCGILPFGAIYTAYLVSQKLG